METMQQQQRSREQTQQQHPSAAVEPADSDASDDEPSAPASAAAVSAGSCGGFDGDASEDGQARKKQRVTEEGAATITAQAPQHCHEHNHTRGPHTNGPSGVGVSSGGFGVHLDLEIRLLIESSNCGALIGKGGSNISRVRSASGAHATILRNDSSPAAAERVLQLRGTPEAIGAAAAIVLEILHNEVVAPWGSAVAATINASDPFGAAATRPDSLVLLVHQSSVGALIGAGGSLIKANQAETGARIHIESECMPFSTDKMVTLTGTQTAVHAAFLRVLTQLLNNPLKPGARTALYVPGIVGGVPGLVAAMMPMQSYGGGSPRLHGRGGVRGASVAAAAAAAAAAAGGGVPAVSAPHGFGIGMPFGMPSVPSHFPGFPPPLSMPGLNGSAAFGGAQGRDGGGGGGGGGGPRPPRDRTLDPSCTTHHIAIPAVCSGVVLGKGGSIVRTLAQRSGAKISLAPVDPSSPAERAVAITGTPDQIQAAMVLIQQQVDSYTPGRPPPSEAV